MDERSFAGADLEIRKAYGAMASNFIEAFSRAGELDNDKLKESLSKIPKAEVFGHVGEADMNDERFKKAFALSVDINMVKKMSNSREISPEKFQRFLGIIEQYGKQELKDKIRKASYLGGGATEEVAE